MVSNFCPFVDPHTRLIQLPCSCSRFYPHFCSSPLPKCFHSSSSSLIGPLLSHHIHHNFSSGEPSPFESIGFYLSRSSWMSVFLMVPYLHPFFYLLTIFYPAHPILFTGLPMMPRTTVRFLSRVPPSKYQDRWRHNVISTLLNFSAGHISFWGSRNCADFSTLQTSLLSIFLKHSFALHLYFDSTYLHSTGCIFLLDLCVISSLCWSSFMSQLVARIAYKVGFLFCARCFSFQLIYFAKRKSARHSNTAVTCRVGLRSLLFTWSDSAPGHQPGQ